MTKRPNVKKTEPTVHSSRPVVHPYGTVINFIDDRKFRKPFSWLNTRDRGPQKVQDGLMEQARQKRARRRAKRENEVETGGWR